MVSKEKSLSVFVEKALLLSKFVESVKIYIAKRKRRLAKPVFLRKLFK